MPERLTPQRAVAGNRLIDGDADGHYPRRCEGDVAESALQTAGRRVNPLALYPAAPCRALLPLPRDERQ